VYSTQSRVIPTSLKARITYDSNPGVSSPALLLNAFPAQGENDPSQATYSYRGPRRTDQETWIPSNGDRIPPNHHPGDSGHEFWTSKTTRRCSHPRWLARGYRSGGKAVTFEGALVPSVSSNLAFQWGQFPSRQLMTSSEKAEFGTRAVNDTIPTLPSVSAAQFLGELRQLPRMLGKGLMEERANVYRGLGSEYLNVQFGWVPFIKDLTEIVQQLQQSTEVLRQFHRDSGRIVRRRWSIPSITSWENGSTINSSGPFLGSNTLVSLGMLSPGVLSLPVTREDITVHRYTFSGAYTYHVPVGNDLISKLDRFEAEANRLVGAKLTPSVIWELAPWSWLIDWHGTIGSALENASALAGDELVLRYGYLMRETVQTRIYRVNGISAYSTGMRFPDSISMTLRRVTKERVRANPYGFTLAPSSYSLSQWSILGALGLTKAPRVL